MHQKISVSTIANDDLPRVQIMNDLYYVCGSYWLIDSKEEATPIPLFKYLNQRFKQDSEVRFPVLPILVKERHIVYSSEHGI